jgi:methyl-accepting chemotaxis protein
LIGRAGDAADMATRIAGRIRDQASAIGRISDEVAALDGDTQQNAALAQNLAAASERLHEQSQHLVARLGVFGVAPQGRRRAV